MLKPKEYIERDMAGFFQNHARYTHYPSGKTLVRQPFYTRLPAEKWHNDLHAFLGAYSLELPIIQEGEHLGTIADWLREPMLIKPKKED
jgi:hypothetical protein